MTEEARITPYGIIFGAAGLDQQRFADIREQEEEEEPATRESLMHLPAAGALLRDLLPPDEAGGAHSKAVEQVAALIFHAYRYWRCGRMLYRMSAAALEHVLGAAAAAATAAIGVPAPAGYLQLPRHALWARIADELPPEPVDGFFWSAPVHAPDRHLPRLDLLLALGVRADRPGISTVDVSATPANLVQWARTDARPDGTDFANVLPGGELQGYHALTTRAEALKLAALCFAYIQSLAELPLTEQDGDAIRTVDG